MESNGKGVDINGNRLPYQVSDLSAIGWIYLNTPPLRLAGYLSSLPLCDWLKPIPPRLRLSGTEHRSRAMTCL
jgi:hypothetical protein